MKRFVAIAMIIIVTLVGCGPLATTETQTPEDFPTGALIMGKTSVEVKPEGLEVAIPDSIVLRGFDDTSCCGRMHHFFGEGSYYLTIRNNDGTLVSCAIVQKELVWQRGTIVFPCGQTAWWMDHGQKYQVAILESRDGEVRRVSPWSELFTWSSPEECPPAPASEPWTPEEGPDVLLALHSMTFDPHQGWVASYYEGQFGAFLTEEIYPILVLDLQDGSPALGVPADGFSATFVTMAQTTGTRTWNFSRDDGMRVWVGTPGGPWQLVHDSWEAGPSEGSFTLEIENVDDYIVVAFWEGGGWAHIRLNIQ